MTELCTKEFITLIQEFPESSPCLEDLKVSLNISKMNDQFVTEVIGQLQKRLLTIGRSSSLILSLYIKTIDVMKLLDPSTLMLEEVSDTFKQFLNKRLDTLQCIIQIILYDDDLKLYEQLDNQKYVALPGTRQS